MSMKGVIGFNGHVLFQLKKRGMGIKFDKHVPFQVKVQCKKKRDDLDC